VQPLAFCGARRFITAPTRALHLSLSSARPIQSTPKNPSKSSMFRNRLISYGEGLLAPSCLSSAAYATSSQLPSTAGGSPSIRNLRTRHVVVTGTHLTWDQPAEVPVFDSRQRQTIFRHSVLTSYGTHAVRLSGGILSAGLN
jgi:hypothetical protein